jgi:predicted ABC-type ATPase
MPEIIILGGPNGAGKTSTAKHLFRERIGTRHFVNADEIARGLSPYDPEAAAIAAGRIMLRRMLNLAQAGDSFVLETTCAGVSNLNFARRLKRDGWKVILLFLWLPRPELSFARVARRVREGGHSVPRAAILRRWRSGLANVREHYLPLADIASIHDNSDESQVLVAEKLAVGSTIVHDEQRWHAFMESPI